MATSHPQDPVQSDAVFVVHIAIIAICTRANPSRLSVVIQLVDVFVPPPVLTIDGSMDQNQVRRGPSLSPVRKFGTVLPESIRAANTSYKF